jgi:hypothetical protein
MAQHGCAAEREKMQEAPEHALDVRILFSYARAQLRKFFAISKK